MLLDRSLARPDQARTRPVPAGTVDGASLRRSVAGSAAVFEQLVASCQSARAGLRHGLTGVHWARCQERPPMIRDMSNAAHHL